MKNQITIAAAMVLGCAAAAHGADVTSPGGQITVHADVIDGVPTYSVDYKGKPIVKPSASPSPTAQTSWAASS